MLPNYVVVDPSTNPPALNALAITFEGRLTPTTTNWPTTERSTTYAERSDSPEMLGVDVSTVAGCRSETINIRREQCTS
ncbi:MULTISPECIES: hypothetical protein [unclassified Frankia]|uniref:hypothetical protein n=1 Tax=unclassified Frankia TaxID=2632575 RepID=UPI001EF529C1|nr:MULTISPECIES: hypothetical protein [unclassified Frankia]